MNIGRVRLYHRDFPKGQIFTEKEKLDEAQASGWVDAPWKINEIPEQMKQPNPPPVETPAELKPWQKALAARKAKREGGKK